MINTHLTTTKNAMFAAYMTRSQIDAQAMRHFAAVLDVWRYDGDVTWAELMAAWVNLPAERPSPETIRTLIEYLESK